MSAKGVSRVSNDIETILQEEFQVQLHNLNEIQKKIKNIEKILFSHGAIAGTSVNDYDQ